MSKIIKLTAIVAGLLFSLVGGLQAKENLNYEQAFQNCIERAVADGMDYDSAKSTCERFVKKEMPTTNAEDDCMATCGMDKAFCKCACRWTCPVH